MSKSQKKLFEIAMDIFRELYANSTPKGNFDELLENAPIMEDGKKYIPFDEYEIDKDMMCSIVNFHMKSNKLTKYEKNIMKHEIYLGPSPKIKLKNKDKKDE